MELTSGDPWIERFNVDDPVYSSVYFRSSSKYRTYNSDPYKILDLLGDMGGLVKFCATIGMLMTISHVRESFARSILQDTY